MSDEKLRDKGGQGERLPEIKASPEVQSSAVIDDSGNQARWERAQAFHNLGQDESATELFNKPGELSKSTSKFGIDGLDDQAAKKNTSGIVSNVCGQEVSKETIGNSEEPSGREYLIAQALTQQPFGIPESIRQRLDASTERLKQDGRIDGQGNWHFQNPGVKPEQDIAGELKEALWNTFNPSPGKVAENSLEFLYQFVSGTGKTIQDHMDKNDPVLKDFEHSPGAEAIRKQFTQQGFPPATDKLGYGTWQAFEETVAPEVHQITPTGLPVWTNFKDWSSVGTQVGGFGNPPKDYTWARASATRCNSEGKPDPRGTHVNYNVINLAGRKSFLYHIDTPLTNDKPLAESGPMRTIVQRFSWIEPISRENK